MIEPDDLRLPQHLKQFALHECLGRGPQGGVYRASETGLGRVVAIKVLAPERADSHREQQFFAQAAAAARVIHPNVVQIYFVGQDGPFCFCAREYVQGESLANVLSNHSPLAWPVLVHILHQALRGLVAAHALDLTHGNLTPSNVLIDQTTGRVLLSDFGVSAELVPTASRSTLDRQGPATVKNDLCQLSHLISRLLPLTEPPSGKSNVVLDQQRLDDILSRMAENVGSNSIQSASMALQALGTTGLLNPDHAPLPAPALSDANVNPGYATSVDLFRVTTLPEVPEAVFDDTEPRQGWLGRLRSLWPFRVWSRAGVAGTTESHPVTRRRWYVASQLTIALLLFLLAGYLFNEMLRKQRARRPQMSRGPLTNAEKYPHLTRFNSPSPDNQLAWIPEPLTDIPLRQLNLPYSRRINKLAALPQGSLVATVSNDASLRIWSPSTGQELQRYIYFPDHQFTSLECVACRPDGCMIAVAAGSSPARIFTWDPVSEQMQWIVTEPKAHAVSIEYQADGKHLAVLFEAPQGGLAQTYITLFDAFNGRQVERLDWDEKQIRRIACSPTAPLMACQVRSHLIRFWDSQAHTATHQFTTGGPSVTSFAFSQDGKRLAVATENDDVMLWNIAATTTEKVIKNRKGHLIKQIAWSPHEKYIAAIGNGITTVWDVATGEVLRYLVTTGDDLAFSADGRYLVTASRDVEPLVWDVANLSTRRTEGLPGSEAEGHDSRTAFAHLRHLAITNRLGSDDYDQTVDRVAPQLLRFEIPQSTSPAEWHDFTFNRSGMGIDGLRFKPPTTGPAELHLGLQASGNLQRWSIARVRGPMEKMPTPTRLQSDSWPELRLDRGAPVQLLSFEGGFIDPREEYVLWFCFDTREPVDMRLAVRLQEAQQIGSPQNLPALHTIRGLGWPPPLNIGEIQLYGDSDIRSPFIPDPFGNQVRLPFSQERYRPISTGGY